MDMPVNDTLVQANSGGDDPSRYVIRAVDRALDVLDLLQTAPLSGMRLPEIAKALSLPKSSAFRYLTTLELRGFVARETHDTYRIAFMNRIIRPRDVALLVAAARPRMDEVCRRYEETINLGVMDGTRIAYLEVAESPQAMRFASRPGSLDYIHSSALGKALAGRMTENEVRHILALRGMPTLTPATIDDEDRLIEELKLVASQGYAIDNMENEPGGRCVAVVVPGPVAAAISLSAPTTRFPAEDVKGVAQTLNKIAEDIAAEVQRVQA